jgi:hypothetical protein
VTYRPQATVRDEPSAAGLLPGSLPARTRVIQLLLRAVKKLKDSFGETESFHLPDRWRWGEESTVGGSPSE